MDNLHPTEPVPSYDAVGSSASSTLTAQDYAPLQSTQTLQLLHVSKKMQRFSFPPGNTSSNYDIRINENTGLIKRPDLIISRDCGTLEKIGEGKFEKYGSGTTIKYLKSGKTHDLQLESAISQRFMVTVDGTPLWWCQPSRQNILTTEVVSIHDELMARFTYSGDQTLLGIDLKNKTVLGVLEVDRKYTSQPTVLDQIVSMTVTLVERGRRRGRNLHRLDPTSPMASIMTGGQVY